MNNLEYKLLSIVVIHNFLYFIPFIYWEMVSLYDPGLKLMILLLQPHKFLTTYAISNQRRRDPTLSHYILTLLRDINLINFFASRKARKTVAADTIDIFSKIFHTSYDKDMWFFYPVSIYLAKICSESENIAKQENFWYVVSFHFQYYWI